MRHESLFKVRTMGHSSEYNNCDGKGHLKTIESWIIIMPLMIMIRRKEVPGCQPISIS